MGTFLRIVLWGTLAFIAVAVVQERQVFLSALGLAAEPADVMEDADEQRLVDTVRSFLSVMSHCYASGGDPRFLERLPAAPEVAAEIRRELVYLEHNRRRQAPVLMRLEVVAVEPRGEGRAIVRTREYWVVRTELLGGGGEAEPARSMIVGAEYRLVRSGTTWQVIGWEPEEPGGPAPPAGEGPDGERP